MKSVLILFERGKCRVYHYQDILEAKDFNPYPDTFFCTLTYNPEARRLANTQGEIRVGASHQAKLPVCRSGLQPQDIPESCELWEQVKWQCKADDDNLLTYLQAARSIAAFAGMCDRGNADDMYDAAQRDDTTINALNIVKHLFCLVQFVDQLTNFGFEKLHENNYDTNLALQCLVKCPILKGIDRKWNEDDQVSKRMWLDESVWIPKVHWFFEEKIRQRPKTIREKFLSHQKGAAST